MKECVMYGMGFICGFHGIEKDSNELMELKKAANSYVESRTGDLTSSILQSIDKAKELPDRTYAVLYRDNPIHKSTTWGYWDKEKEKFICAEYGSNEGDELDDVVNFLLPLS